VCGLSRSQQSASAACPRLRDLEATQLAGFETDCSGCRTSQSRSSLQLRPSIPLVPYHDQRPDKYTMVLPQADLVGRLAVCIANTIVILTRATIAVC